jgi:hypothetical protein
MRPAALPNAFNELSADFARLSWPVKALVAAGTAVAFGFVMGAAAVGPILSKNSPDNDAAVQARFERRTVDPNGHYPDPHPYRAQSPDFGPNHGPALGAYAKQQAQRELRGRGGRPNPPAEAREAFGAAQAHETVAPPRAAETTGSGRSSEGYRAPDRHTGVSY